MIIMINDVMTIVMIMNIINEMINEMIVMNIMK